MAWHGGVPWPLMYMHDGAYTNAMSPFAALADPTRVRLLDLLCAQERSVTELVQQTALPQPAVSQHLRVLKDAGLVPSRPVAQRRLYRVRPEPLQELDG